MRLEIFDKQARLSTKIISQVIRYVAGFDPDIVRMLLYRKEFFGGLFNDGFYETLRGESEWGIGERELMAAYVSRKNECRYCTDVHRATAERFLGQSEVDAAFSADPPSVGPKLRAALEFLDKLTLAPKAVSKADIDALRRAGVSDEGIRAVAAICAQFSVINRLADTFGFRLETKKQLRNHANILSRRHYKF